MLTYEIGKPFPEPLIGSQDTMFTQIIEGGTLRVIIRLTQPSSRERHGVRRGLLRYGVFVEAAIPTLLMQFGDADMEFDSQLITKPNHPDTIAWIQGAANLVTIILVDEKHVIRAMRGIGFEPAVMDTLRTAIAEQQERYSTPDALAAAVNAIVRQYSIAEMLKRTKLTTIVR